MNISEGEIDVLNHLFRKSKQQIVARLKKEDHVSRERCYHTIHEVLFENCKALTQKSKKHSCVRLFRTTRRSTNIEGIAELVNRGHLEALFKLCETRIGNLPNPKTKPKEFVKGTFELILLCTKICNGQFNLNPNTDKKFMQANESTINSSSSSAPSEKYCADDSESEQAEGGLNAPGKVVGPKKRPKRVTTRVPIEDSGNKIKPEQPKVPVTPKSDDRSYLADVESVGSETQKMDLEKWAEIYKRLKEDLREEFDLKEKKASEQKCQAPTKFTVQHCPENPSLSKPLPQQIRVRSKLTPMKPIPLSQPPVMSATSPPPEIMMNFRVGTKSKPASLKSEQVKVVLARKQQMDEVRIKTIEANRQNKETRVAKTKMDLQSEEMKRRTIGQMNRNERAELAKIKRQLMEEEKHKSLAKRGIIKKAY